MEDVRPDVVEEIDSITELRERITKLQQRKSNRFLAEHLMHRLEATEEIEKASQARQQATKTESELSPPSPMQEIAQHLQDIKQLLSLKATASITYEGITDIRVKNRLLADNMRMEKAALNVDLPNSERFFEFCTDAFNQIENLLNYYYWKRYPNFNDCVSYLKQLGTEFSYPPAKLSDIPAHNKLFAFEKEYYYTDEKYYTSKLALIRKIRNSTQHRCTILEENHEKHYNDYLSLLEKIETFKRQAAKGGFPVKYEKTNADKKIEENSRLAVLITERNYDLVRNELVTLYKKVVQNLAE